MVAMIEIRFHGRGGQGAVIGSEVLAHAFFLEGKYVQAFPAFGVERRGAPVTAFCRIDEHPILLRNQIYAPDHVVVLDSTLLTTGGVTRGLKSDGAILLNGRRPDSFYREALGDAFRIFAVDAAAVAIAHKLGSTADPIVNTAILGAFARASGLVPLEAVEQAIEACLTRFAKENRRAARDAFGCVRAIHAGEKEIAP
jgi:2-oxoacid:acceptor oxidoreductase gamma subunit (pyruvate/2-ketoisovalerate family)